MVSRVSMYFCQKQRYQLEVAKNRPMDPAPGPGLDPAVSTPGLTSGQQQHAGSGSDPVKSRKVNGKRTESQRT